jgi:hypothetical protein
LGFVDVFLSSYWRLGFRYATRISTSLNNHRAAACGSERKIHYSYHPLFLLFFFDSDNAFNVSLAFCGDTTFLPVLLSSSSLANLATLPPCFATVIQDTRGLQV